MEHVIRADGVVKRWGRVTALAGVTVDVPTGITGLLGANGAGKTTLLGLVLGLYQPDEGRLEVLGHDPGTAGPDVRRRIGYAPEHDALPPEARAQDLVRHVAELHGLPRRVAATRASETLDLVGLGEERLREIGTMSLGQRQRVKLAQALAHDPDLVLLDEPTNGLDPLQREDTLATIRRVGRQLGIPVVVSSHLLSEVERVCDAVVVLDGGTLTTAGRVSALVAPGDMLLVEVDGGIDDLVERLRLAGTDAVASGPGAVRLTVTDDEVVDRVRDAVADLALGLRRLTTRTTTLEERIFTAEPPPPPPPHDAVRGRDRR